MIEYFVSEGYTDKHDRQVIERKGIFSTKEAAMNVCNLILKKYENQNETIKKYEHSVYKSWQVVGWDIVTICTYEEVEVQ